jgi:hypothetical protein
MTHDQAWKHHTSNYPTTHEQRMVQDDLRAALRIMHKDKLRDYSTPPNTYDAEQESFHT